MKTDPTRRRLLQGAAALLGARLPTAVAENRLRRVVIVPTQGEARAHRKENGREEMLHWLSERFAEEGFVTGRDIACEYVDVDLSDADGAAVERRARAIVDSRPDAILCGEDGIYVLQRVTKTIPLVFYKFFGDPVAFGLVQSYRHPGGNITGTSLLAPEGDDKGWELLRELSPKGKRIGVMWRDDEIPTSEHAILKAPMKSSASRLGFEYVEIVFAKSAKFAPLERTLRNSGIDVLVVSETDDPWVPDLMRFLERARIPALWPHAGRVREGGLCAANASTAQAMRDAVAMVALILRGADPATLPVRVPTRFLTVINVRTARAMGLEVPPAVLVRATAVGDK